MDREIISCEDFGFWDIKRMQCDICVGGSGGEEEEVQRGPFYAEEDKT